MPPSAFSNLSLLSALTFLLAAAAFFLARDSASLLIPFTSPGLTGASSAPGSASILGTASAPGTASGRPLDRDRWQKHPYASSWNTWWQNRIPTFSAAGVRGQGGGRIDDDWNILYHLGGNGPWIEKVDGVLDGGIVPPPGCRVEQVHMMSRHHERYPTIKAGTRHLKLMEKLKKAKATLSGDLKFLNSWKFFSDNPQAHMEQLTSTGPYAGTLSAFTTGLRFRSRYERLLPRQLSVLSRKPKFWASDCRRVIDTARYFAAGFYGIDWENIAELQVIPETDDLGADTLTPGDTCKNYVDDLIEGHDMGYGKLAAYKAAYIPAIRKRLLPQLGGKDILTDDDVYAMQEMCGFETLVRGRSLWCDVFTPDEWRSFEYARDLIHFYRSGPGNKYGAVMGWLWLNATAEQMSAGRRMPFYFSFVHDGDIVPMLAALNIFNDTGPLPVTHEAKNRAWRTTQVTPMGGRVTFELLVCSDSIEDGDEDVDTGFSANHFVRININDGIVMLPGCDYGPGKSCPLRDFQSRIQQRGEELGDFREICGLKGADVPDRITFLHP